MISEQDIELAHPEAFDFAFGNLPRDKRAEFNRHLAGCRYCQAIIDEYADIGRIIKNLPPHAEPPADLEDRTVAAMVAALAERRATTGRHPDAEDQAVTRLYPRPGRQPAPEPQTRIQPIPQFQPPAENETKLRPSPAGQGDGRAAGWADGHTPACMAAFPGPPGRCCRSRRGHHRCRCRPAQPEPGPGPGRSHSCHSASCHYGGQGKRLRRSHRPGDRPSGCLRQLGYHLDRAAPEELRRCEVVPVLVRQHTAWPGGLGWHVPRPRWRERNILHDQRCRSARLLHHGDHRRPAKQRRCPGGHGHPQRPDASAVGVLTCLPACRARYRA